MLPNCTLFNGSGSEHSYGAYHIPLRHYTNILNKKGTHHLVIMEYSKTSIVYTWYRTNAGFSTGIRKHVPMLTDANGSHFLVHGNKVRF